MQAAPSFDTFEQAKKQLRELTPPQLLLLSYVFLSVLGTLLLKLPAATTQPLTWMQALFTSVSASTITGLVVVDTGSHFTLFGQLVLLFLIQAGGLGLMTFGVFLVHLTRGDLSLGNRIAVGDALNHTGQSDMRRLLRWLFGFTFTMEAIGAALLALHWVPELGWSRGWYYSFFHAVSAFNNAGFALAPDSLSAYVGNPIVNGVISLLFIAGGIGFIVVADMMAKRRFRDYALHTKLMLVGTVIVNLLAMLILFVLEYGNPATLGELPDLSSKLWGAWFMAVTPRSSGFNTTDTAGLLAASAFFIMGLMFIGGGSGSTGGGIKLSTFIVLLLATRTFFWRQERPVVFGRSISHAVVLKALAITVISLFFALTGTFLLTIVEPTRPFLDLAFEAVSAAATVGLSRGVTAHLSDPGLLILITLMLIGRVGPLTLVFMIAHRKGDRIRYPEGQVNVG
jgi:trk system potassium uptake protein TrkH